MEENTKKKNHAVIELHADETSEGFLKSFFGTKVIFSDLTGNIKFIEKGKRINTNHIYGNYGISKKHKDRNQK